MFFVRTFCFEKEPRMGEQSLYTRKEMRLVYASVVAVSTVTTLPMLIHVFMMDPVEFKCGVIIGQTETVLERGESI